MTVGGSPGLKPPPPRSKVLDRRFPKNKNAFPAAESVPRIVSLPPKGAFPLDCERSRGETKITRRIGDHVESFPRIWEKPSSSPAPANGAWQDESSRKIFPLRSRSG